MAEFLHHTIAPVYDAESRILILGSFPSVKSREAATAAGSVPPVNLHISG